MALIESLHLYGSCVNQRALAELQAGSCLDSFPPSAAFVLVKLTVARLKRRGLFKPPK